jgi:hypothetical protein
MADREIWSVTDIHVDGLPYAVGQGISRQALGAGLPDFRNVSFRHYGFYGKLLSHLPPALAEQELDWFRRSCADGSYVAGVWIKNMPGAA